MGTHANTRSALLRKQNVKTKRLRRAARYTGHRGEAARCASEQKGSKPKALYNGTSRTTAQERRTPQARNKIRKEKLVSGKVGGFVGVFAAGIFRVLLAFSLSLQLLRHCLSRNICVAFGVASFDEALSWR